ncbi:PspC domain-containing protein [Candidatus Uhrbacteria bacterium]|nr:PspC domain-containing protein [Candidatus Uhrbacteria bacterium]
MIDRDRFRPLRRLPSVAWIGGVCAGIAYSVSVPTWAIRMVWVFVTVTGMGWGILAYVLLWAFMPVEPRLPPDYPQRTGDRGRV